MIHQLVDRKIKLHVSSYEVPIIYWNTTFNTKAVFHLSQSFHNLTQSCCEKIPHPRVERAESIQGRYVLNYTLVELLYIVYFGNRRNIIKINIFEFYVQAVYLLYLPEEHSGVSSAELSFLMIGNPKSTEYSSQCCERCSNNSCHTAIKGHSLESVSTHHSEDATKEQECPEMSVSRHGIKYLTNDRHHQLSQELGILPSLTVMCQDKAA